MGNGLTAGAALHVARVFRDGTLVGLSDRHILDRFVACHDEMAFEAILMRHGPMVRNVCRQILFDPHDVDDAVQAVFLVLVRKARFIRVEHSLGPWLYSVAGRVAARARANRRKRRERESLPGVLPQPSYCPAGDACEMLVVHEELSRLPERLRAPLVLCYLEGLTHDLAASQLDCPVGTVRSRLARGRSVLHRRITRRGVSLSAAGVGALLESNGRAAGVSQLPASLVAAITGAMLATVRHNGISLSTSVSTVLGGVLNVSKIKKFAVLATVFSVGALTYALGERAKVAGQTPKPLLEVGLSDAGADPSPLGPDGRRIGVLHPKDSKAPYVKTYYVGDLIPHAPIEQQRSSTGAPSGEQPRVDMTPMMELIQLTVARGTWVVRDMSGNDVSPKELAAAKDRTSRPNSMVPFLLSLSVIIKCSDEVHEEVTRLFRALRRVKFGSDEQVKAGQLAAPATNSKPAHSSNADRKKKIDQLLEELREEVQELDHADSGAP